MDGGSWPGDEPVRPHLTNLLSSQWLEQVVVGPGSPGEWAREAFRIRGELGRYGVGRLLRLK